MGYLSRRAPLAGIAGGMLLVFAITPAIASKRLKFWNTTAQTITHLSFAPVGTEQWGPDQCANDPDGSVESDERMPISVQPGRYDVKLTQKSGRTCVVHNVDVKGTGHYAFAIEEGELTDCSK